MTARLTTSMLVLAAIALAGCGHTAQTMATARPDSASAQAYLPPDAGCGSSGGGFHGGGGMPSVRAIGPVGPGKPGGGATPAPCRAR